MKRQRRKQSNRESARRSRLRKQAECEALAVRVNELMNENVKLRAANEQLLKLQHMTSQQVCCACQILITAICSTSLVMILYVLCAVRQAQPYTYAACRDMLHCAISLQSLMKTLRLQASETGKA